MSRLIAHRGNSSEAPENTFAAFDSAIDAGITLLECDVQRTRDGRVIVIHDATLERTGDRPDDVRELTLDEVRAADVCWPGRFGDRFQPQRVATLAELLIHIRGRAQVLVEIKKESSLADSDAFERAIAEETRSCGARVTNDMTSDLAFISFGTVVLERMRAHLPEAPRGHLFYRPPTDEMFVAAERVAATFLMPEKGTVTADLVTRATAAGLGVATWVCDDPDEMRHLLALGVLGVGTNRPVWMRSILGGEGLTT